MVHLYPLAFNDLGRIGILKAASRSGALPKNGGEASHFADTKTGPVSWWFLVLRGDGSSSMQLASDMQIHLRQKTTNRKNYENINSHSRRTPKSFWSSFAPAAVGAWHPVAGSFSRLDVPLSGLSSPGMDKNCPCRRLCPILPKSRATWPRLRYRWIGGAGDGFPGRALSWDRHE
jgi:hypothetical protein